MNGIGEVESTGGAAARRGGKPRSRRSRRASPFLLAPLALAAALPLLAQETKSFNLKRTPTPGHVPPGVLTHYDPLPTAPTVPPVVGRPRDEAVLVLRRRDFLVEFAGEKPTAQFPPGVVAEQDPPGGSPVPPGPRVVRLRLAVPPPPTAAPPAPTETPAPEQPPPTERPDRPEVKRPPPFRPPPPPPPPPPSREPWVVVLVVAAVVAAAYLLFRRRPPADTGTESAPRAPRVEVVPRADRGDQEIVSAGPVSSGLTLHPVADPGEQTLEVRGPLILEGGDR